MAVVANVYSSSAAASVIVIAFYAVFVAFEICTELIHFTIKVKSWSKYKCNLQKINWND